MEIFDKILFHLQDVSKKQFERYILYFLLGVVIVICGMIYFMCEKKDSLRLSINRLYTLSDQVSDIVEKNKKIMAAELKIKNALEKKRDFTIKGFFESFCKEQNINPDPGWDTRTEAINDRFDEVVLPAEFKGYTMERLVQLLGVLDKEEIVYVKEVIIKADRDKKINFTLTLATNQLKSQLT